MGLAMHSWLLRVFMPRVLRTVLVPWPEATSWTCVWVRGANGYLNCKRYCSTVLAGCGGLQGDVPGCFCRAKAMMQDIFLGSMCSGEWKRVLGHPMWQRSSMRSTSHPDHWIHWVFAVSITDETQPVILHPGVHALQLHPQLLQEVSRESLQTAEGTA